MSLLFLYIGKTVPLDQATCIIPVFKIRLNSLLHDAFRFIGNLVIREPQ